MQIPNAIRQKVLKCFRYGLPFTHEISPSYCMKVNKAKALIFEGQRTVIVRKGRLMVAKKCARQTNSFSRLQAAFQEGGGLNREPTAAERKLIQALAQA